MQALELVGPGAEAFQMLSQRVLENNVHEWLRRFGQHHALPWWGLNSGLKLHGINERELRGPTWDSMTAPYTLARN